VKDQFPRRLQANPPRYKSVKLGSITIVKKLMKARAKTNVENASIWTCYNNILFMKKM